MRTPGSAEFLEERRRLAIQMLQEGAKQAEVVRRLRVSKQSVSRWNAAFREGGVDGVKAKPHPGPARKLRPKQLARLQRILLHGALVRGYHSDLWTRQRVAEVIEKVFGVHYHTDHISRLLVGLGWSCQKPERQARERNDDEVQRWIHSDWERIKKKPRERTRRSASSIRRGSRRSPRSGALGRREGEPRS
jgi:transposase